MCNLTKSFLEAAKSRFVIPELVLERRKEKAKRSLTQVHLPNFSCSKKLRGFEDAKVQKCRDANLNLQELREGPCAALATSQKSLRVENWSCFGYGT